MPTIESSLNAQNMKVAVICARFNELITSKLLGGAKDCLLRHGLQPENLDEVWVPGAFEIPLIAKKLVKTNKYQAVITLGAVIRGATSHYDYVCSEVSKGVSKVALDSEVPVIFGVLTTDTLEQALERAGSKAGNKGWDCGMAAIEMASLCKNINSL